VNINRLLSIVPIRAVRVHTGTQGSIATSHTPHLEALLHWLSPLTSLEMKDQIALGLHKLRSSAVFDEDDGRIAPPEASAPMRPQTEGVELDMVR
jgi:hypothetical protein